MDPRIEIPGETKLVGIRTNMSFVHNKTAMLWQRLMPKRKEITNSVGTELYSVEVFNDPMFFKNFDPIREFEKWAAVKVKDFDSVPGDMEKLVIPSGMYVVFLYKGKPSEGQQTYQYIYSQWIPGSEYVLDNRPHFALMGEKYKGEHPESEEELWIPIRKK